MIDFFKPKYKCDVPIIWLTIILMIIVLMCSCSANRLIKMAIKKDPNILKADTMYVHDTLVVPQVHYDTTIISNQIDTILIEKERLRIKITRHYDTLRIEGTCLADTIYKQINIPVERIVYAPKKWYEKHWWIILLVGLAVAVAIKR